jgi:hypothetical protein
VLLGAKFCGSCNPDVDLPRLWKRLREAAPRLGHELVAASTADRPLDGLLILCACPRACTDRPAVRALSPMALVVAGETVDLRPLPEEELCEAVLAVVEGWRPGAG